MSDASEGWLSGVADIKDELEGDRIGISKGRESPLGQALSNSNEAKDCGFETVLAQSFTATVVKEEPYDDIIIIFKESPINYEKQVFHRQIFQDLIEKNVGRKIKLPDLQAEYIAHLRKSIDLEIFKCSLCNEYESIHKENLKCHLLLVHKTDLNYKAFRCKICKLQQSRKDYIQKHMLVHETNEDSNENPFYESIEEKNVKNSDNKKCDLCSFETENFVKLRKHRPSHKSSDNSKYICYVCSYENQSKVKLKKHLLNNHNIETKNVKNLLKKWKCDNCDYSTDLKKSFEIHTLSHKDPNEIEYFNCASCDFKTKHKGYLKNHFLLKHKDPSEVMKKYMCEICSRRFRVRAKLKIHMFTHKTLSELTEIQKCTQCDYQTKTKAALYTHMELHRDPKYVCDLCGHQSRRKWNHEMHLLTHKKDKETDIFRCTVCSYKTHFKSRFRLHLQKGNHFGTASRKLRGTGGPQAMDQNFSDNLKFNCFVCNFETMHRKVFSEHSKTHDNSEEVIKKRFVCEICGFRARHKTHLHTHSVTHKTIDQVEPLKCEKCDFITKSFHSLASHRQLHKEPKIVHTCDICGLKNRRKYNHDVHVMTHKSAAEVPLIKCDLCNYQTKFKAYLREHLKKRHNILTARRPGRPLTDVTVLSESLKLC